MRGWVAGAYGERADALVLALPRRMDAAEVEALLPSTQAAAAGRPQRDRAVLWDDLRDLRSLLLEVDVGDAEVIRDRRLRAAISAAIGAASSLALATSSQPTAGYLRLTRLAVDGVLEAAGRGTSRR